MMPKLSPATLERLRALRVYFQASRNAMLLAIGATVLGAATEPLIPALMQPLLDKGFQRGGFPLWLVPLVLLLLFALRGTAGFVAQYALARAANTAMQQLRGALFAKLMRVDMGLFARTSASSLSNTVIYEVQNGCAMLVSALQSLVKDALTLLALVGYLLYLNWRLSLIVALVFPALAVVMSVLSRRLHRVTKASQVATDTLAYVVEENALASRIVRLHNAQAAQQSRFESLSAGLRQLAMKSTVASSAMTPITQMLAAGALSAVITTALWQSASNGVTVGSFAAFVTAMLMLIAPIKHLSEVAGPITRGMAALGRGLDLLAQEADETEGRHQVERARGEIELHAVHVRYSGHSSDALNGINLQVQPGECVALVGASGSGKSSLVNLLPRFVAPSAGVVRLDGRDLREWRLAALRTQFALVSQDVVMFNDSIAANVALGGTPGQPPQPERVRQALQAAHLLDFALGLPQGLDTVLGHNATQLSGGQRQRLAIARAIYKDAPILLLDEATSALDTESERAVQAALQVLMRGRTTLIVAHRLSTIQHADRIVVLNAGRIVETGTHSSLLAAQGAYARLHQLADPNTGDIASL